LISPLVLFGICEKGHMSFIFPSMRESENGGWTATEINVRGRTDLKDQCVSSRAAFLESPAVKCIVPRFDHITLSNYCDNEQPCASNIAPHFQIFWLLGPFILNGKFCTRRNTYQLSGSLGRARKRSRTPH
jgi:hypothetical protein